ncbi:nucleotidyltransferase family protein [Lactobacillus terrae]|uniref:nucleotidyltransferase family protein n=1 Tax=Lactobacillus terrae TaxID=2269374 RepID=UPI000C1B6DB9|nr:nucleotidyltransferase family protein [Lactobacillus terrae]
MKIYGFVAEFNPFHNGHKKFIDEVKRKYDPDVLIAIVSGNYVQRGDFSIIDKWQKAELAVEMGVDLVVELPFAYAVQPADLFAKGSISLLKYLKINHLVFGTENELDFVEQAKRILELDGEFEANYSETYGSNLDNYLSSNGINSLNQPNQLLGVNYVMEILKNNFNIEIKTIHRNDNKYSATKIRNNLITGKDSTELIPILSSKQLNDPLSSWDKYFLYLKSRIVTNTAEENKQVYQVSEGLDNKFVKEIQNSNSWSEFLENVKSKRYTYARIRRLAIYMLLNVYPEEIENVYNNPYIHILGMNETGKNYLNSIREDVEIPVVPRIGKKEQTIMSLDIKVDRIIELINDRPQIYGKIPYMKGDK